MPLFRSNTKFLKGLRGDGWATPEYYGAKGDIAVNDKAAIQAALDDLATAGGTLIFGPRYYRCDSPLTIYPSVSLKGASSNDTHLVNNHATTSLLAPLVGTNYRLPTVISDINFGSLVANTGLVMNMVGISSQCWIFDRCTFNDPFGFPQLRGSILSDDGTSSANEVTFRDCYASILGSAPGFQMNKSGCRTNFIRGTYKMPSGYTSDLMGFYGGGGLVDGATFDLTAHSTGAANCILANTVAPEDVLLISNTRTVKPSNVINSRVFLKSNADAYVKTKNIFTQGCTRYTGTGILGVGTFLELETYYADAPSSLSYDIRQGYSSVALWLSLTGNPTFNLPIAGTHLGQRMAITITNLSGATIGGYTFGNLSNYAPTAINDGKTISFIAEFSSTGAVNRWMPLGTPLAPYTA